MIAFLIDADNFSAPAWIDEAFQALERTEGPIAIRRAYGSAENLKGLADTLRIWAIRPFVNLPLQKNTTDMALAVDAMELACQVCKPNVFVVGSGDLDFVPLVVRLREKGIKVICVSERGKMAQDAVRAYDQVVYVGGEQLVRPALVAMTHLAAVEESLPPVASGKIVEKMSVAKTAEIRPLAVKKVATKKVAKKAQSTITGAVTVSQILEAAVNLKMGLWQPLGDVAKVLHDKKLLAKSATSTKLFRKFPHHFELMPAGKPNQVRFILPP